MTSKSLATRQLTSLGDDGSVSDNQNGALEFVLEMLDDLVTDKSVKSVGSVRNSDVNVFAHGSVSFLVFHLFS